MGGLKRKAVTVEVLASGEKKEGPFVVDAPMTGRGQPLEADFKAWRKNQAYRGRHMILRGRSEGVDWVGTNFEAKTGLPEAHKHLLARLAPTAPGSDEYTLQFMPLGGGKVFRMQTRRHNLDYAADESAPDNTDLNDPKVRAAVNEKLLKAFSSQKRQRKVAKMQAQRRIDASTLADPDTMEATLKAATAVEMTSKELAALAGTRRNIPPHNPEATNAFDAYPLDQTPLFPLLDRMRWKELLKASKKPSLAKELREKGVDEHVLSLLPHLVEGGDDNIKRNKAKALALIEVFLAFHAHKGVVSEDTRPPKKTDEEIAAEGGGGAAVASPAPQKPRLSWAHETQVDPLVQRAMIDEFMELQLPPELEAKAAANDPKKYLRPKAKHDLSALHIIVLQLRVCNWDMDIAALSATLKRSQADLVPHCKELGCKTSGSGKGASAKGKGVKVTLHMDGKMPLKEMLPEIARRPTAKGKRQ